MKRLISVAVLGLGVLMAALLVAAAIIERESISRAPGAREWSEPLYGTFAPEVPNTGNSPLPGKAIPIADEHQDDSASDICHRGYATSRRLSRAEYVRIRYQAFARAGISVSRHCTPAAYATEAHQDCYALDHIIPLELGGTWDLSNLQVQPHDEAKAKDLRENAAHRAYCAGRITLDAARAQFYREYP